MTDKAIEAEKECTICGSSFLRAKKLSDEQWDSRRYCSLKCANTTPRKRGLSTPLRDRLQSSITIDKTTGCWEWTRCLSGAGYGQIGIAGKVEYVHRISFEQFVGKIPDGQFVLHSCDNPRCCNPDHLFLGTHQDNMNDMSAKGRTARNIGEKSGRAKLTEEQVMKIRSDTSGHADVASRYGVAESTIRHIRKRSSWRHI